MGSTVWSDVETPLTGVAFGEALKSMRERRRRLTVPSRRLAASPTVLTSADAILILNGAAGILKGASVILKLRDSGCENFGSAGILSRFEPFLQATQV